MPQGCPQNIRGWGEMPLKEKGREEVAVEDCNKCKRYDTCDRRKDEEHYERYCMTGGEGCDRMYRQTEEERRMEI